MTFESCLENAEGLIRSIANKFYNCEYEDLYQAGVLGLQKAYNNYKENNGTKFTTYAYEYIWGSMYLIANQKMLKVNRDTLKLVKLIETTRNKLAQKLNKIPSNYEIAQFLNMDINVIEEAIMSAQNILSLEGANDNERDYYERIKNYDLNYLDNQIDLNSCLEMLTDEQRKIIEDRYFNDLTQSEIAKKLGMSQVKVSRYEQKGLERMKELMVN